MRSYFLTAPPWVVAVATGLLFGLSTGIYIKFAMPIGWTGALAVAVAGGSFFGAVMAYSVTWSRSRLRAAVGELPPDAVLAAERATYRGPPPADPRVRAAALEMATQQLGQLRRFRLVFVVGTAVCALSTVLSLIFGFEWRNVPALIGVVVLGSQLYWPRRLRRRIQLLSDHKDAASS